MIMLSSNQPGLTVYCARAGDHNDRAMEGALALGTALAKRLGVSATVIGKPEPALNSDWETELAAANPALLALADHVDHLLKRNLAPLCALSRCAASLATLPVLMRHRPDACVVWLDAHADLNTPATTLTSYLGGMALAGPAGLWDSGLGNGLPLANIILAGARDLDPAEQALVDAGKVRRVPNGGEMVSQLRNAIAGRPLYIHLDCDVLEPGIVPTDYKVAGGLALAELHAVCQVLAKAELIGLEIAEFETDHPESGETATPEILLEALDPVISRLGTSK